MIQDRKGFQARLAIVALLGLAAMVTARPAMADPPPDPYAAVVCDGNRALVRFILAPFSPSMGAPRDEFVGSSMDLPDRTVRAMDALIPTNPARCTLADGREVVLKQGFLRDASAGGRCGGLATPIFTLQLGPRTLYRRAPFRNACDWTGDYAIRAVLVDGDRLVECSNVADPSTTRALSPPAQQCVDKSELLAGLPPDTTAPGAMVLVRAAAERTDFCRSFVRPLPDPDWLTWPPFKTGGREGILAFSEQQQLVDDAEQGLFDLTNEGVPGRAVHVQASFNDVATGSVWLRVSPGATREQVERLKQGMPHDPPYFEALRSAGVIALAGDQTAFKGRIIGVHLTPMRRDGVTWMHATSYTYLRPDEPTDLILRPTPKGTMEEVCAFRANPPL